MNTNEMLRQAAQLFQRGDLEGARRIGESLVRARPQDPTALQLLGVILCRGGDLVGGVGHLRNAMRAGGDTPVNRFNLARALMDLGDLDEAERLCAGSDQADLKRLHADILKALGRQFEATQAYEDALTDGAHDFEGWNNLGNARAETGDTDGAIAALEQAIALNPRSSLVHTNLGRVLMSAQRYEDACLAFEQAALTAPGKPEPLVELGRALSSIGHHERALRALGDAAKAGPGDSAVFLAIGQTFSELENQAQAEKALRFALQVGPRDPAVYLNLGILMEKANRVGELETLVNQARQHGVNGGDVDYLEALLLSRRGDHAAALELARAVQSESLSRTVLSEFIGRLSDRLNYVDAAYFAFDDMNDSAVRTPLGLRTDREDYGRGIAHMAQVTTPEWFASWQESPPPEGPPAPVFLVGFPRSGTTLLDTVLLGHEATHVLEEVPVLEGLANQIGDIARVADLSPGSIADLRRAYLEAVAKQFPESRGKLIVDKNPLSMLRMALIHRLFPDARIIMALRHPCDVVLSCFMQNFKVAPNLPPFIDLEGISRIYDAAFAYWEQSRSVFPLSVHTVRYEDMIEDLEGEMRPLLDFLGLPWDDRIIDYQSTAKDRGFIRTPSYAQVTEKLYNRASGRWQRYRHHLAHVLPILEPWAQRFGYGQVLEETGRTAD